MNNEIEFKFGDYAIIEQKRHGAPNEMYVYKVIGQLRSNKWVDVPVWGIATEILHKELDDVCLCIRCGIDETVVHRYRVKDMQRSNLSPNGGEVTALALTLEKSREASGCPAGVDLQDWVKQLAEENLTMKDAIECHKAGFTVCEACGEENGSWNDDVCKALDEIAATDRIIAEAEARGIEKGIAHLENKFSNIGVQIMNLQWLADSLREGAAQ